MLLARNEQSYTLKHAIDQEVPRWLKKHAHLWIQDPSVEAVVLFGSRSTGHAKACSDWDVAILHGDQCPLRLPRDEDLHAHAVDLPVLALETYLSQAHCVGSLAHEVALHGRVLAGYVPTTEARRLVLSEVDLSRHLEYAFRYLAIAISDFHDVLRRNDPATTPLESIPGRSAVAPSANGAERVAKALCLHLGLSVIRTHDVEELADRVPIEWREKVLAMDGNSRKAHLSTYLDSGETLAEVERRISSSLTLLAEIVSPCCKMLSDQNLASLDDWVWNQVYSVAVGGYLQDPDVHRLVRSLCESFEHAREILHDEHLKRSGR